MAFGGTMGRGQAQVALPLELRAVAAAAEADPLAMPQRTLPTDAAGIPKHTAQLNCRCAGLRLDLPSAA
jgi:hypothetical protein